MSAAGGGNSGRKSGLYEGPSRRPRSGALPERGAAGKAARHKVLHRAAAMEGAVMDDAARGGDAAQNGYGRTGEKAKKETVAGVPSGLNGTPVFWKMEVNPSKLVVIRYTS